MLDRVFVVLSFGVHTRVICTYTGCVCVLYIVGPHVHIHGCVCIFILDAHSRAVCVMIIFFSACYLGLIHGRCVCYIVDAYTLASLVCVDEFFKMAG